MKKAIISLIICIITFGIIFLNINSKENKKEEKNKNISIILETEEGNIKSNTFPSEYDYEYSNVICENTNDNVVPTFNTDTWKLNLSVEKETIDGNFNCTVHFKEHPKANPPELDTNMIPVYYDEANAVWRKADETNTSTEHKWYDYDNRMWANSVTVSNTNRERYVNATLGEEIDMEDILTMQVWIPRYKYKIWNYNSEGTSTSEPQQILTIFERGTESTGEITCVDNIQGENGDGTSEVCKLGNDTCTDNLCNGSYYTHPAFTFGSEELTGFWVGKFEVSTTTECTPSSTSLMETDCNLTTIEPLAKPNVSSWRGAQISVYDNNIRTMNVSDNIYGFTNNVDTHMIKNIEWGSIAYLSHSKYGICDNGLCHEIGVNNNTSYITGCGSEAGSNESATCNSYETTLGKLASTTGNIYGVYDISGGAWDYVMGNIVSSDGITMMSGYSYETNSGYTGILYNEENYMLYEGTYNYPDDKYYDKYSYGKNPDQRKRSKLGDAVKEILVEVNGWYNGYAGVVQDYYPWAHRGGHYKSAARSRMFHSSRYFGSAHHEFSTRFLICLK